MRTFSGTISAPRIKAFDFSQCVSTLCFSLFMFVLHSQPTLQVDFVLSIVVLCVAAGYVYGFLHGHEM